MSLFESEESNGTVSLSELFKNPEMEIETKSNLELDSIIFAACRGGGWPGFLARKSDRAKLQIARDYIDSVCETDVSTVDGVKRNPTWASQILRSYSRNISMLAKTSNILKDVESASESISIDTLSSYIQAFEKLFIVQDIEAWCPSIRSATAIRFVHEYNEKGNKPLLREPDLLLVITGTEFAYRRDDGVFVIPIGCLRD